MGVSNELKGSRLEYVTKKLNGTIKRAFSVWDKGEKRIVNEVTEIPAGYMVYLPSGQSYRMSEDELKKRGLDASPTILGFADANDTKTAAGRFKLAVTEADRKKAMKEMEDLVIMACTQQSGTMLNAVHAFIPTTKKGGKINVPSAA